MSVALVIIQNHQFVQNLDVLDRLYRGRFAHIVHLVPFYRGERTDVIPVFENSFNFQGYIAQAARSLLCIDCSHFLFIADDLLLNPSISQTTLRHDFHLPDDDTGYITGFIDFPTVTDGWLHAFAQGQAS